MSWPSFLSPWWGLLGLLAVPLILLYLLRQKRPDLPISSTLLWSKVLADLRASTPFQKLRHNLLLLLQLLVLAALVFARMRPVVQSTATPGVAGVIILDATASMQATDHGGPSRLDRAKAEAHRLVDTMRPGDRFQILVGGEETPLGQTAPSSKVSGFLTSKPDLHAAIDAVKPTDLTSDLSDKLIVAAETLHGVAAQAGGKAVGGGGGRTEAVTDGQIWLFSDGTGVRVPNLAGLEGKLRYVKIGDSRENVGIVQLDVRPVPKMPRTYQVFVGLVNTSARERTVTLGLAYANARSYIATQRAVVPAAGQGSAIFQAELDPGRIVVQLSAQEDDFALDNTAYGLVEPSAKVRVILVSDRSNFILERFLAIETELHNVTAQLLAPQAYRPDMPADLVIFDHCAPAALPKCDCLLIRPPASVPGFEVRGGLDHPPVLRWKREEPVMSFVDLSELQVDRAAQFAPDGEATALVTTGSSALLAMKDVGSARQYALAFDPLLESNWWGQTSLLIFLQNVVSQTQTRHFIGSPQVLPTGQVAKLWDLGPATLIRTPQGQRLTVPTASGALEFAATDHVGFYDVISGEKKTAFAVNLFSPTASAIEPKTLEIRGVGNVPEVAGVAQVNREVWPYLAVAALTLLLLEWWVYHRRIG